MTREGASRTGLRGKPLWLVLAAGVLGVALVVTALVTQRPDAPELSGPVGSLDSKGDRGGARGGDRAEDPAEPTVPDVRPASKQPLGPSRPVSISIPALDVRSEVFAIGKTPDGSLAVPQPGPNLDKAAWYENSPTPGQPGPAIIEGHVATDEGGPSIFYDLAELRPGDEIRVTREDGIEVVFRVQALREFAKDEFPTELVYAGEISEPSLRLITCSNFDPSVGTHTSNLIVFSERKLVIKPKQDDKS